MNESEMDIVEPPAEQTAPTKALVRQELQAIIAQALGLDPADVDMAVPFMDMGASSLALVDIFRAIYERFGVRPSIRKVFETYDCVDRLAEYVVALMAIQPVASPAQLLAERQAALSQPAGRAFTTLPLTAAQTNVWFLAAYSEGAMLAHTRRVAFHLTGGLDVAALQQAFQTVADRHEALRLTVDATEMQQRIALASQVTLTFVDFEGSAGGEQQAVVSAWLRDESRKPFEPTEALWRAALLRLAPARHLLVVSAHALIADEQALRRLLAEAATYYSAALANDEPLGEAAMPLRAYFDLLSAHESQPRYARSRAFWSELYADGIPQVDLAWSQPRPPVKSYAGNRLVVALPAALAHSLRAWNTTHKSSPFATILAAFQIWLQRLSGQTDIVVGVFSRGDTLLPRAGALIANTTNPLPLRTTVEVGAAFAAHLRQVQQCLLTAFDHQDYPFSAIIHDLHPDRDQSRSPVFTVAFDWQPDFAWPSFRALGVQPVTAPVQYVPYDLILSVAEANGQMQLQCDYSTELFDAATMRRWMNSFRTLLAACLEPDEQPVARLPVVAAEERRQLLVEWNNTRQPYPQDMCLHHPFEAQAAKTPEAIAVTDGQHQLTYAELNTRAEQVAAQLRQAGVGPGDFVALCLDRTVSLLVGVLGILKAGGAYIPLDPTYPVDRLAFMLHDSQAKVLVAGTTWLGRFPRFDGLTFLLEDLAMVPARGSPPAASTALKQPRQPAADDVAINIYTSGSTGRPKGVLISHRNVVNLLHTLQPVLGLTSTDRWLAVTTLSFDISETELFMPLAVGATIVLVSRADAADAERLQEHLHHDGITFMQATPVAWQMLVAGGWMGDGRLTMLSCGEAVRRELADALLARGGVLWNFYGPTETTIYSALHKVEPGAGPVPIGRPVANTQLYVLDRQMQPAPIGVPGELYIGGDGVSRGYWQRPDLTAEKFMPDPFAAVANETGNATIGGSDRPGTTPPRWLYRTGDLVRYLPNGDLLYLGRMDFQVKIRGFRIELGEVESALSSHPAVERNVVVAREDDQGRKYLAAYFTMRAGQAPPTTAALRAHLAEQLPDYMIPAAFVPLAALPLTPNRKVDRKALPEPGHALRAGLDQAYAAPRNRVEEILCRIWSEVLVLEKVGIHDSFFDLGGDSLRLTQLMLKLREYFRMRLSLREFFAQPTVAELAGMIAEARRHTLATEDGQWISPTLRQDGPEAKARFDFLRAEAQLDPAIQPQGRPYVTGARFQRLLLTGATGFVGAYLLRDLIDQTDARVYCLVRAADEAAGLERIRRQAERLGLWRASDQDRLRVVLGDVSQPRLGLNETIYRALAGEVDTILHSAAAVNFIYPYQALRSVNVDGVRRIIEFAFAEQVKPVHYLSTTAIWPMGAQRTFTETMALDQDLLLNLPYDETKWVGEKMLGEAAARGLPVAIYRPGEVSGDSRTGTSDLSHLASALLKGSLQAGIFPAIDSFLDAAPVDYVAQAIVFLMTQRQPLGRVFHLCNPRPMHAHDAYQWLRQHGYIFDVLPFDQWRWRIFNSPGFAQNALYPFAAMLEEFTELSLQLPVWDTTATIKEFEGSDVACPAVDTQLADTYLRYYIESGYIHAANPILNTA